MTEQPTLRLMAILAHPDDESLGNGAALARYAAEGIEVTLVTATRGQRGWFGDPSENPGLEVLGATREAELRAAGRALGLHEVVLLDYVDGDLETADHEQITCELVAHIRRVRPDVVVTWGPEGGYGHPDHMAIGQFATAAVMRAADPRFGHRCSMRGPHAVSKLYYLAIGPEKAAAYSDAFGDLSMDVDGVLREPVVLPAWLVRTRIDAGEHWRTVWQAVACHRSQLPNFAHLAAQPEAEQRRLWGSTEYTRVFSTVSGAYGTEDDLFAGLRADVERLAAAA
ncbi:MAG TPA: PIG-L deacetylase family protein [Chloroflexota bacterium]|jgi:LmbE family N-acetylglucosaminyl deacetylase